MRFLRDNAEYWHTRAEEVRTIAETATDPEARRILFDIVESYVRLVEAAAQRGNGHEV
jgi:hypothetical protein